MCGVNRDCVVCAICDLCGVNFVGVWCKFHCILFCLVYTLMGVVV